MHAGGWSETSGGCGEICDGMPVPSDPAWKLVTDDHGCQVWSSAGATGPRCGAPIDSGFDTRADAPADADADADAPACPTTQPTRLDACTDVGQVCFYACGTVMRCTSAGWDFDTTIDGGPPCP